MWTPEAHLWDGPGWSKWEFPSNAMGRCRHVRRAGTPGAGATNPAQRIPDNRPVWQILCSRFRVARVHSRRHGCVGLEPRPSPRFVDASSHWAQVHGVYCGPGVFRGPGDPAVCAFPAWHAFRVAVVSSWPVWRRPLSSEDRVEDRVEDRGKIAGRSWEDRGWYGRCRGV